MTHFWHVNCAYCGQSLRLTAEDKDLGRTVEAICPTCKHQTSTTIGGIPAVPKEEPDISRKIEGKFENLLKKIATNPEINEVAQSIQQDGYDIFAVTSLHKRDSEDVVTPKVDSMGEIVPGTFTKEDEESFHKAFRIKL